MKFVLEIDCGNAAFGTDDADRQFEVVRILNDVRASLNTKMCSGVMKLYDYNGNVVGTAKFVEQSA